MHDDLAGALRVDGARLWASLERMAQIGATPKGGVCRLALTELDRAAFAKQIEEMEENLKEEEPGNALDRAIARLDHFKVIQQRITSTGMH